MTTRSKAASGRAATSSGSSSTGRTRRSTFASPAPRSRSRVCSAQNSLSSKLSTSPARRANQGVERPAPSSRIDQSDRIRRRSQPIAAGTIQGRSGASPRLRPPPGGGVAQPAGEPHRTPSGVEAAGAGAGIVRSPQRGLRRPLARLDLLLERALAPQRVAHEQRGESKRQLRVAVEEAGELSPPARNGEHRLGLVEQALDVLGDLLGHQHHAGEGERVVRVVEPVVDHRRPDAVRADAGDLDAVRARRAAGRRRSRG